MKVSASVVSIFLLVLLFTISVPAQTTEFTYQGSLQNSSVPANGNFDFEFLLYDAVTGGVQLGATLTRSTVAVAAGTFAVKLDFGSQFPGANRFLEIRVRIAGGGAFTPLAPRQSVNSTPYSVQSLNATNAATATYAATAGLASTAGTATNATQLNAQPAAFYQNAANLSSGTLADGRLSGNVALLNAPQTFSAGKTFSAAPSFTAAGSPFAVTSTTLVANLNADLLGGLRSTAFLQSVPNPLTLTGTSSSHIIRGENASTLSFSSGVFGASTGTAGQTYGGRFESASPLGTGVMGRATAGSSFNYGGDFRSASTDGTGVLGWATAGTGITYAVQGRNDSTTGRGVYGLAAAGTGTNYGVYGQSYSDQGYAGYFRGFGPDALFVQNTGAAGGRGIQAIAFSDTAIWATTTSGFAGLDARNAGPSGLGVFGLASSTTGTNYGVLGQTSSSAGFGVFSSGNMGASGVKPFRIDHPDDPANKYLLHYSTESPEVLNAYSGKVTLDAAGEAVVELPAYFAKINRDPRYTLTAVGSPMPMLHVAKEIDEAALTAGAKAGPGEAALKCTFRIAGGAPGAKVSWRIEAVRNDVWVRTKGAAVEVEKQGVEKGTYQHPELYGQPAEKGINYDAAKDRPALDRRP